MSTKNLKEIRDAFEKDIEGAGFTPFEESMLYILKRYVDARFELLEEQTENRKRDLIRKLQDAGTTI